MKTALVTMEVRMHPSKYLWLVIVGTVILGTGAITSPAHARVSLSEIDAKLDEVLTRLGGQPSQQFISESIFVIYNDRGARIVEQMFEVPAGKLLIVDYVSILIDPAVRNRPTTPLRIRGAIEGTDPNDSALKPRFDLGFMEEYGRTSRGTPNFLIARELKAYYAEGPINCITDTRFGGVNLDFGSIECAIAGRLIDAPND